MKKLYEAMIMLAKEGIMVDTIKVTKELAERMKRKEFDTFADVKEYGNNNIAVRNEIGRMYGVKIIEEDN